MASFEIPDPVWNKIVTVLPRDEQPHDPRAVMTGIMFKFFSGCPWSDLKRDGFVSGETARRWALRWFEQGAFKRIKDLRIKYQDRKLGVNWAWLWVEPIETKLYPLAPTPRTSEDSAPGNITR